jgi:very-short-patch-repair endonuclease
MVSSGRWLVVTGDVLTVAGVELTEYVRLRAAALATNGVISHASAAKLWRLPVQETDSVVHVTVEVPMHHPINGVRIHRRPLGHGDRSWVDGFVVTSRNRTVLDCLLTWPNDRAADLIDHVLRTRLVTLDRLEEIAASAHGKHGAPRLRGLVEAASAGAWSAAERRMHLLLRGARIGGWLANHPLALPGHGGTVVADIWFPDAHVAIEVDGAAWHTDRTRFQRDRERQNALVLAGATVLRFTWADITTHAERVVHEVQAALSAGDRRTSGEKRSESERTEP